MQYKKIIIGGAVVLVIILIVGILFMLFSTKEQNDTVTYTQEVSTAEPVDIVLDFYNMWLDATKSTTTNPYLSGFATSKILSKELQTQITTSEGREETEIDPVLCQTTTPERATGRVVSLQEDTARILVMAKEKELTAQSIFTLKRYNNGWYIDSILCAPGEFELPREFSFETEGYLLKDVPPPFDPQHWHIVFAENGELGHVAPLFFETESICKSTEGDETVCVPDTLIETTKIFVQGQMTESGVTVKRLVIIPE